MLAACGGPAAMKVTVAPGRIAADGYDTAVVRIETEATAAPVVTLSNPHSGTVIQAGAEVRIRAGVMPGHVRVRVAMAGARTAEADLEVTPFYGDIAEDGTPDFARLQDERDQRAFRREFTRLAEIQYFEKPAAQPAEINDCAALIRFAYREALRNHEITKYRYPYTPLGASLFRVQPGAFLAADLSSGAFAQFADAKTLWRLNTHLVGRVLGAAVPGDLLFFRQESGTERYHSMIYLGPSQVGEDGRSYILYHTGPEGSDPGEIRRVTVDELVRFPRAEWRPLEGNPRFLGVFRWNILRKEIDTAR